MKVVQLRCGFATNSSSTHSVIIMPKGSREAYDHFEYGTSDDPEFGWEFWTAASPEAKTAYADDVLSSNLPHDWPDEVRAAAMRSVGARPRENGVDHQSVPALPVSSNGTFFDAGFFKAYKAFLQRPDVVILGGNDNTDEVHTLAGEGKEVDLGLGLDTGNILSEHHPGYTAKELKPGIWCLFSKKTGTRAIVDMRLDDTYGTEPITYDFPLLVDLRITNACSMGCPYCYMSSTSQGKHAEHYKVEEVIGLLKQLGALEIALGGGEPTEHPQFAYIVRSTTNRGLAVNFTTRSLKWLKSRDASDIVQRIGGFGFSVDSAAQATKAISAWKKYCDESTHALYQIGKLTIQYVLGSASSEEFEKIVRTCGETFTPILLLGYKTVGFGKNVVPQPHADWMEVLQRVKPSCKISIDTLVAQQFGDVLDGANVPKVLYTTKEGETSMYVDAVEMRMGPSSYCAENKYVPVPKNTYDGKQADKIKEWFKTL